MAPVLLDSFKFAPPAFNPITAINWDAAYWASGTEAQAQGWTADGAVATWPDEIGSHDATQATESSKPTYRAAGLGGQPCLEFDGTADFLRNTDASLDMAAAFSVVAIMKYDNPDNNPRPMYTDGDYAAWGGSNGGHWNIDESDSGVNDDTNNNLWVAWHRESGGYQAVIEINGSASSFNHSIYEWNNGITIGKRVLYGVLNYYWDGKIAFLGLYNPGDVRSHSEWANFESWVTTTYGITIA